MSSKEVSTNSRAVSGKLNSHNTLSPTDGIEFTTNKMASAKLNDLPTIRPSSRLSGNANISISRNNSDTSKSIDERQDCIGNALLSTKTFDSNQLTLESLDAIRTIGTGKNFMK